MRIVSRIIVALVGLSGIKAYGEPKREYLYVGGNYVNITTNNTTNEYLVGQIYIEKLTPPSVTQPYPIIFVAGAGQTGTNWLNTPQGGPGWASYFLSHGYTLYLTDQPSRGRSPWFPDVGSMATSSVSDIEIRFTATSRHNFWPQSRLHNQWPGTGVHGDPIFDAFYATQVQYQANSLISEDSNAHAYMALLDKIGPAYLITHSQAGPYGWRIGDTRPDLVKGIIALEPSGPPFESKWPFSGRERTWGITDLEIQYEPIAGPNATYLQTVTVPAKDENHTDCIIQADPAKKLVNLAKIKMLVVTSETSFHAPYDYCTVEYLRQAGVNVKYLDLGTEGIHGNGHMMFMEKNNREIAERLLTWLNES